MRRWHRLARRNPRRSLACDRRHADARFRIREDVRYIEVDGGIDALAQTLPWGVDRIDADVAQAEGETGEGADVSIIDTGIDADHPDLEANLGAGKAFVSCEGSACTTSWDDDNDHGTHCAGIASAVDNSRGVVGVSSSATLHAAKVLDSSGSGSLSDVAAGIEWTADQGYEVGSLSLGTGSDYQTLQDACQYAADNGVLLVAAAGNSGPCTDCVNYPAAYDTTIAVSATAEDDSLAGFSSTGPEVELAAPGKDIYSTIPGGYATFSGTSMACPHVSGVGGLLMAGDYTNTEARRRLRGTAEDIGLSDNEQGYGLVDAEGALPIGEAGTVSTNQPDRSTWRTVSFEQRYDDPVVLMKPLSFEGGQPAHVRLRNVASDGFEFQIEEWAYLDGSHISETIHYTVIEAGTYTLASGTTVEAGRVEANHTFTSASFSASLDRTPVVLTESQTRNGGHEIVTRNREVTTDGFDVRIQEEEGRDGGHKTEAIGYLAVEPGTDVLGSTTIEAGRTANTVTDDWEAIGFEGTYDATPLFAAGIQTFDGPDTAALRYRSLGQSGVETFVEEERSADDETNHTTERVGYLVLGSEGLL
ncbi:hypothetical protein BRC86_04700 [Halobacteriales archaeon QS_3_64_16]|nr:MAG: hypothetical protein BRC86_04700 [Halobacteriales archaeon QS_3_64_16]